jgi:hypothetical protein
LAAETLVAKSPLHIAIARLRLAEDVGEKGAASYPVTAVCGKGHSPQAGRLRPLFALGQFHIDELSLFSSLSSPLGTSG